MVYNMPLLRPWLNWIEQQISNLWVAGSSPAGRAIRFRLRYSETGPAWRDGVLEKRMSRCNERSE